MSANKLFLNSGDGVHSETFSIAPHEALILTLTGLEECDEGKVFIERLIMVGITPTLQPRTCLTMDCTDTSRAVVAAATPIRMCGKFYLGVDQPIGILNIPGYYRMTLSDPKLSGYIQVYAEVLTRNYAGEYPASLIIGNK